MKAIVAVLLMTMFAAFAQAQDVPLQRNKKTTPAATQPTTMKQAEPSSPPQAAPGIPAPEPVATNATQQPAATWRSTQTFLGHRLGETWSEFDATEHTGEATTKEQCTTARNKKWRKETTCKTFVSNGWVKRIGDATKAQRLDVEYVFCPNAATGTLCKITVEPNLETGHVAQLSMESQMNEIWPVLFNVQLAQLAQKFGPATKTETKTFQNAFGAHWEYPQAEWVLDDGTHISANEWRSQYNGWLITFERQAAEPTKPAVNPY